MPIEEYESNSHKSKEAKEQQKRIAKPVTTNVTIRKKSEIRRLADVFIPEDVESVKSYILKDVIVPAIKKTVVDVVSEGINMLMYGNSGRPANKTPGSNISYNNYYASRNKPARSFSSQAPAVTSLDYENIIFESRGEVEEVLSQMMDALDTYGTVSIGDLYDLVGKSSDNYQANKYGWSNLRNAEARRIRDGWVLKLPKPFPLD